MSSSSHHRVDPKYLGELQKNQANIRNICILAHVDHGKTTLSDSLISSNGIISDKLVGKLRYLDSTEEEQKRGITMHSSAISLYFNMKTESSIDISKAENIETKTIESNNLNEICSNRSDEYLINLIDCPGHIDFSSDVSTATRLCDGALLVIDVLEGICTQTHAVIYKALKERMKPCLVLNKIDRLCIEMMLSPTEAFYHLRRLVEQVNALAFTLLNSEKMKRDEVTRKTYKDTVSSSINKSSSTSSVSSNSNTCKITNNDVSVDEISDMNCIEDSLLVEWTFDPDKGNVVFACAFDCWGFNTAKFANIWSKRLNVNMKVLKKYLFEDYVYHPTTMKIVKLDPSRTTATTVGGGIDSSTTLKPMFATMILEPLWQLYDAAIIKQDVQKAATMASKGFGITLLPREINPRDPRATLQAILRRWLPLADAVLKMVVRTIPDPIIAQKNRLITLLPNHELLKLSSTTLSLEGIIMKDDSLIESSKKQEILQNYQNIRNSVAICSSIEDAPVIIFVSKMIPLRSAELTQRDILMLNKQRKVDNDDDESMKTDSLTPDSEVFIALARVFSGTLKRSTKLYVLGNKFDPLVQFDSSKMENEVVGVTEVPLDSIGLYIMLGPSVQPVEEVQAGNIVGIIGLSNYILKTATLSSSLYTYPMNSITFQAKPMLKVAVESHSHVDLKKLEYGMQQLHQFDPVVEVGVDHDTGQLTMTCLGELHLEQCVKALSERFAKCDVTVSEPLIAFRETLVSESCDGISSNNSNVEVTVLSENNSISSLVLPPPWCDIPNLKYANHGRYRLVCTSENLTITFRCFPLPNNVVQFLEDQIISNADNTMIASCSNFHQRSYDYLSNNNTEAMTTERELFYYQQYLSLPSNQKEFWNSFTSSINDSKDHNLMDTDISSHDSSSDAKASSLLSRIISIGSRFHPVNLLVLNDNTMIDIWDSKVPALKPFEKDSSLKSSSIIGTLSRKQNIEEFYKIYYRLHNAITAGFQTAVEAGPLMREPLYGIGYCIEKIEITLAICNNIFNTTEKSAIYQLLSISNIEENDDVLNDNNSSVILSGQLISEVKESLHLCMLSSPMRIVEPIYQCDLQCDQSQLGNLYGVLAQRRGDVFKEDIIEGTSLFLLSAYLPVYSSFGFAQQLLKKTSGQGTAPQLHLSHWSIIEKDPFWKPITNDEKEEFGEYLTSGFDKTNLSRTIIDQVRKRKGLQIEEKVVMFAEKQRTLNKKK